MGRLGLRLGEVAVGCWRLCGIGWGGEIDGWVCGDGGTVR